MKAGQICGVGRKDRVVIKPMIRFQILKKMQIQMQMQMQNRTSKKQNKRTSFNTLTIPLTFD